MKTIRPVARVAIALVLAALLLATGCSVALISKRAAVFAPAASMAVQQTSDAFDVVEQTYHDTQVSSLVLNYDTKGFHPEAIKPFMTGADLEVRQKLLQSLKLYAETLADLASNKPVDALDEQAREFGKSLGSLAQNETVKKLAPGISDGELKIATAAIDTLGRWFVDRKRNKELPKIISDMNRPITQVADLLIRDIGMRPDAKGQGGRGLRNQLWSQYDVLLENQDSFILTNEGKMSVSERRQEIEKLPKLVAQQRDADLTLATTQDALRKMVTAHAAMLTGDKSDTSFQMRIADLIEEGKQIQSFYSSLAKK